MKITELHSRFAARVQDIDLSAELAPAIVTELSAALDRHSVLVFPQQDLTPADQVRFSAYFGPLEQAITRIPKRAATMTSGIVDIPTTSAPIRRNIRYSALVS